MRSRSREGEMGERQRETKEAQTEISHLQPACISPQTEYLKEHSDKKRGMSGDLILY